MSESPAEYWSLRVAEARRLYALTSLGFTDRQARFLALVLQHAGVFVERQYCAFAGIAHGQKTHNFIQKLVECRYATAITIGPLHRGRIIRVHHRALYAAIRQPHSRLRKPAPRGRMIERLMILDAMLTDKEFTWLGTSRDKLGYMQMRLGDRLTLDEYPHLTFRSEAGETTRYFPDRVPIGVQAEQRDHVFLYLVTRANPLDFRMFLARHAELLMALPRWTIRLVIPRSRRKARPVYLQAAREELASPLTPADVEDLRCHDRALRQPEAGEPPGRSRTPGARRDVCAAATVDGRRRFHKGRRRSAKATSKGGGYEQPAASRNLPRRQSVKFLSRVRRVSTRRRHEPRVGNDR